MKLSTGRVAFPLHFDNGDVENVMINPHDTGMQARIKNFEGAVRERLKKISLEKYKDAFADEIDVSTLNFERLIDMSPEEFEKLTRRSDAIVEIDRELEKQFSEEMDIVFDTDISSKAFKYVPPLAMVETENGEHEIYLLIVLKALAEEIQKYGNKVSNATNKYVSKYPKNK